MNIPGDYTRYVSIYHWWKSATNQTHTSNLQDQCMSHLVIHRREKIRPTCEHLLEECRQACSSKILYLSNWTKIRTIQMKMGPLTNAFQLGRWKSRHALLCSRDGDQGFAKSIPPLRSSCRAGGWIGWWRWSRCAGSPSRVPPSTCMWATDHLNILKVVCLELCYVLYMYTCSIPLLVIQCYIHYIYPRTPGRIKQILGLAAIRLPETLSLFL